MISSVTGLIQDLLSISHSRDREIFVGAKNKVKDGDVASWTSVTSGKKGLQEGFGNPVCH